MFRLKQRIQKQHLQRQLCVVQNLHLTVLVDTKRSYANLTVMAMVVYCGSIGYGRGHLRVERMIIEM